MYEAFLSGMVVLGKLETFQFVNLSIYRVDELQPSYENAS